MINHPVTGFAERSQAELDSPYERDFYAWTQEQARVLRKLQPEGIDWQNATEEIDSLGRSNKAEIRSRLHVLLMHLLKWELQPSKRKWGWLTTVRDQRIWIEGILEGSPSLRSFPGEVLGQKYTQARRDASEETGLELATIPSTCPYSSQQILDQTFMPGPAWSPDDLVD